VPCIGCKAADAAVELRGNPKQIRQIAYIGRKGSDLAAGCGDVSLNLFQIPAWRIDDDDVCAFRRQLLADRAAPAGRPSHGDVRLPGQSHRVVLMA
jgi:hypothetical protein